MNIKATIKHRSLKEIPASWTEFKMNFGYMVNGCRAVGEFIISAHSLRYANLFAHSMMMHKKNQFWTVRKLGS